MSEAQFKIVLELSKLELQETFMVPSIDIYNDNLLSLKNQLTSFQNSLIGKESNIFKSLN